MQAGSRRALEPGFKHGRRCPVELGGRTASCKETSDPRVASASEWLIVQVCRTISSPNTEGNPYVWKIWPDS
jgi:hypothetical protein